MTKKNRVRLCLEILEARTVPALITYVHHGDLIVKPATKKDAGNDDITITQNGPGSYTVTAAAGTVLNGVDGNAVVLTGVTDDFRIDTGRGNDTVTLTDLDVPDELHLETKAGNDTVNLTNVHVFDDAHISTEDGNDEVNITNSHFSDLHVSTGHGTDTVTLCGNQIDDDLHVELGHGDNDTLNMDGNTVADHAHLNGGDGAGDALNLGTNTFGKLKTKHFEVRGLFACETPE